MKDKLITKKDIRLCLKSVLCSIDLRNSIDIL